MKRALQIAIAAGGLVPVFAGLAGIILGASLAGQSRATDLDSHFRYLSGLLLGIGLAFWSTIPGIESKGRMFQLLTAIVFIGGLARLYGVLIDGWPGTPMICGLAMELVVTPLLCLWQALLARRRSDAAVRSP
jgi:low temperature requirement protein LtrA